MEDNQIIDLYWAQDQRAIDETSGKYGGFLLQLAWNILRSHADAEECVNDTYLHTWNAIPPARPSALKLWLGRIARNLSLDRWKWTRAQKRGGAGMEVLLGELDDCVPTSHSPERCLEDQEIADLIGAFCGVCRRSAGRSFSGGTGMAKSYRKSPGRLAAARGR